MTDRGNSKKGTAFSFPEILEHIAGKKEQSGKKRTAANYRSTIRKVENYLGSQARYFTWQKITSEWVIGFAGWLQEKHPQKPQTVDFYLRTLRAMCNHVRKVRKWKRGTDPFEGVGIKNVPSSHRALPSGEEKKLLDPELRRQLSPAQEEALDVLLFILFARGMVFQDVWNLRWDMVSSDGHIRYLRSKTGIPIDVEVTFEAREIMERHRQENSPFVFPFLHIDKKKKDRAICEESSLHRINTQAAVIGCLAGLSIPLTTYVIRHTWATLMQESGKPVELISQCMGHTSIRTTERYLSRISTRRVDREVNDMCNRMLRPETTSAILLQEKDISATKGKRGAPVQTKSHKKTTHAKKKYPFLTKKETLHRIASTPLFFNSHKCIDFQDTIQIFSHLILHYAMNLLL
ncbi:tyrosine-type recombinase/integrase [Parabacteroides gordonii]|uniref:tyrosine-type recombinase/integrase n=1 Tax=Parabacteroides gordonii TaxID=574930 RepID=UPI0026EFDE26|nr:tyrosine-type recombinase/integrase [Parabacteroides gordonii]